MDFEEDTEETKTVSTLDLLYAIQELRDDFIEVKTRSLSQNNLLTGLMVKIKRMEQDINLLKAEIQSQGLRITNLSEQYQKVFLKSSGEDDDG